MRQVASRSQQPIAVVGMGAVLPGALDVPAYWRNVLARRDLITDVPAERWLLADHWDSDPDAADKTYARRGAFLPDVDFDPLAYGIPPKSLSAVDTTQLLALVVAEQALTDYCGAKLAELDRERASVVLGCGSLELMNHMASRMQRPVWLDALRTSGVDEATAQRVCDEIAARYVPWQEDTFPGLLSNVVAGRIANRFDLHGTNYTVDAACASSLAAVSAAVDELDTHRADLVLTGGVDTMNDITMFMCFSKTPALSRSGDCRPFADGSDGTVLGEGLAMLVLKRLADAERDGDRVYAVIRGIGSASDGYGGAIYAPQASGQVRALSRAYQRAGYGPDTVGLIEAHGTGTRAGDAVEVAALRQVFTGTGRTDEQWCALGSVKSQIGHTKYAAGAAGLIKAALALHHKVLPPTIKAEAANPQLGLDGSPLYLNTAARPWMREPAYPRRAGVSSFGFGGSDFHITLEEHLPTAGEVGDPVELPHRLALFSADSTAELVATLGSSAVPPASDFDPRQPVRLAVVAGEQAELADRLAVVAGRIEADPHRPGPLPAGCWYSAEPAEPGQVAFLFPGQGSQYPGMGADLACWFPAARLVWDRAAERRWDGIALHERAMPLPVGDPAAAQQQANALADTRWAQPALATHSLALLAVLRQLGVRPDRVGGHSFGELIALHAAGAIEAEDLLRLARRRGELMASVATMPAGMLAIAAGHGQVEPVLAALAADAWLVNDNGPGQVVVAGTDQALAEVAERFAGLGVTTRRLPVATAFHSPLVAPAAADLATFLDGCPVTSPAIPVHSNTDAGYYPLEPVGVRRRASEHLASPVRFREMVLAMRDAGIGTFVEVGADAKLTGLLRDILGEDSGCAAIALDRRGRDGVRGLLEGLAQLAVRGVRFDAAVLGAAGTTGVGATHPTTTTRGMTVQINGKNHQQPYPPAGGHTAEPVTPADVVTVQAPAPEAPQVAAVEVAGRNPVSAVSALLPAAATPSARGDELLRTVAELQRQTAEAHTEFQRVLADSHVEFLRTAEASVTALLGLPAVPAGGSDASWIRPRQALPTSRSGNGAAGSAVQVPVPPPSAEPAAVPHASAPAPAPASSPAPASATGASQFTAPSGDRNALRQVEAAAPEEPGRPAGDKPIDVLTLVRAAIAERTGYPLEVISADMDMEADLGIDSIKRVEVLALVRERLGDNAGTVVGLNSLRTIAEVSQALSGTHDTGTVDGGAEGGGAGGSAGKATNAGGGNRGAGTGKAGHASAGGRTTDTDARKVAGSPNSPANGGGSVRAADVPASPVSVRSVVTAAVAAAPGLSVGGLGAGLLAVVGDDTGVADELVKCLAECGVDAVSAAEVPTDASGAVLLHGLAPACSPAEAFEAHRRALAGARTLTGSGQPRLLVTVQDTGGDFGSSAVEPERAWLSGFAALARTFAREWPAAGVKALDCQRGDGDPARIAARIAEELLYGGGNIDVGLRADGSRLVRTVSPAPQAPATSPAIGADSVLVVSGGARGVTAAAVRALAEAYRPRLLLLGRTPLVEEPAGLPAAGTEAELVRALAARGTAAPIQAARRLLAAREVRRTLADVAAAGSPVRYVVADIADEAATARALADARAEWGPITGIVHGAGMLADSLIADKTDEQFASVFAVKAGGLQALLKLTEADPVSVLIGFSSTAAVYGNAGQSDYAMANAVLDQAVAATRHARPAALIRSLSWGPLNGGMVTTELADRFSAAGVAVLPLADGARALAAELALAGPDRVIIEAAPGMGADTDRPVTSQVWADARRCPQLTDHRVGGRPVLPVAMALEWLSRAAGPASTGLCDVRVLRGLALPQLGADGHRIQLVRAGNRLELGSAGTVHYRAEVIGGTPDPATLAWTEPAGLSPLEEPVYDGDLLFHGPRFQALADVQGVSASGAAATVRGLAELDWPTERWLLDPAAIDAGLQLALLWARHVLGANTLPMAVGRLRVHRPGPLLAPARCVVRAAAAAGPVARCDVALLGAGGQPLTALLGVELVARSN